PAALDRARARGPSTSPLGVMDKRSYRVLLYFALAAWAATCLGGLPSVAVGTAVPACSHPVAVTGHFDATAPNLRVLVKGDSDPSAVAKVLSEKYRFTVSDIWTQRPRGFVIKDIALALIPLLQCEPTVENLVFDAVTTI